MYWLQWGRPIGILASSVCIPTGIPTISWHCNSEDMSCRMKFARNAGPEFIHFRTFGTPSDINWLTHRVSFNETRLNWNRSIRLRVSICDKGLDRRSPPPIKINIKLQILTFNIHLLHLINIYFNKICCYLINSDPERLSRLFSNFLQLCQLSSQYNTGKYINIWQSGKKIEVKNK